MSFKQKLKEFFGVFMIIAVVIIVAVVGISAFSQLLYDSYQYEKTTRELPGKTREILKIEVNEAVTPQSDILGFVCDGKEFSRMSGDCMEQILKESRAKRADVIEIATSSDCKLEFIN